MKPGESQFHGTTTTFPQMWSLSDDSMWRGVPDNTKLERITRSMLLGGYKQDETLEPRNRDLTSKLYSLKVFQGGTRVVAARLTWQLFATRLNCLPESTKVHDIIVSLLNMPTLFQPHGQTGSEEEALVAAAARQNTKAASTTPVSTAESVKYRR